MYSLKVVPSQPRKLTEERHKKYITIRSMLKDFNKKKETLSDMRNMNYVVEEMRGFLKDYRRDLKHGQSDYIFSYQTRNKTWAMILGKIEWKFALKTFDVSHLRKNKRHLQLHKKLFINEDKTKMEWFKEMKQHIREKYQVARQRARQPRIARREHSIHSIGRRFRYEVCGGVIHNRLVIPLQRGESPKGRKSKSMGVFMRFLKSGDKDIIFNDKSPQTKDNHIGVELEFFCDADRDALSDMLHEAGLGKFVCLKQDGSIHGDSGCYNHELAILAKEKEIASVVKEACDVLKAAGAKVNKSCGMHVHIDMRNRDHDIAFNNLVSAQNVLFAMNPFSRQTGTYCRRVETRDFNKAASSGRYFGINAAAHEKHKTIEIRIHSGTILEYKVNNWIKILLTICSTTKVVKQSMTSLKAFVKEFDIDAKLAKYIFERVSKFAGEDKKNAEEKGAA